MSKLIQRWRGVAISMVAIVAIGLLALDGKLGLYIHPRYFVFTVVMMTLGLVLVLAACAFLPVREDHAHSPEAHAHEVGHEHMHRAAVGPRGVLAAVFSVVVVVALAVGMLVFAPQMLSAGAAEQRQVNDVAADANPGAATQLVGADSTTFTIRDWARMLAQGLGMDYFGDKKIAVSGFVLADPDDSNVFYVSRYLVTCCAIDAQPVGVPVYLPGWQSTYSAGDWLSVEGGFESRTQAGKDRITVHATSIESIDEPAMPYVY